MAAYPSSQRYAVITELNTDVIIFNINSKRSKHILEVKIETKRILYIDKKTAFWEKNRNYSKNFQNIK